MSRAGKILGEVRKQRIRRGVDPTGKFVNRKMNDETYKLRRAAMEYIYRAKDLLKKEGIVMPRVEIRISDATPEHQRTLGMAKVGGNFIWVAARSIIDGYDLHELVFHELLHAIYSVPHIASSPLMSPTMGSKKLSTATIDKLFLKHIKERSV